MPRRTYPPEISTQVLALYQEGLMKREIAARLSIPIHKVAKVIQKTGARLTKEQRRANVNRGQPEHMRSLYAPGTDERILEMRSQGIKIRDIAEKLEIPFNKALVVCRQTTLSSEQISEIHSKYPKELRDKAYQLYKEGKTSYEIADIIGVNTPIIRFWLRTPDVIPDSRQNLEKVASFDSDQEQELLQLRRDGVPLSRLAKKYNLSTGFVRQICTQAGVSPTPLNSLKAAQRPKRTHAQVQSYPRYHEYKQGAVRRQLAFGLTRDEFLSFSKGECMYCGRPGPNGIDRFDNSLGYVLANCRSCCAVCNQGKSNLSIPDFLEWLQRLTRHQQTKPTTLTSPSCPPKASS